MQKNKIVEKEIEDMTRDELEKNITQCLEAGLKVEELTILEKIVNTNLEALED